MIFNIFSKNLIDFLQMILILNDNKKGFLKIKVYKFNYFDRKFQWYCS